MQDAIKLLNEVCEIIYGLVQIDVTIPPALWAWHKRATWFLAERKQELKLKEGS